MRKTTVRYNATIDVDLYYAIYEYVRYNHEACLKNFNIRTGWDFDNLTFSQWQELAEDAVEWLEFDLLPKVTYLTFDEGSHDGWAVLYYQTLAYMDEDCRGELTYRARTAEEQINLCIRCIEALKERILEMHEPTENDIDELV